MSFNTYREALAQAMSEAMSENKNTLLLGQGVNDFKGIFGTVTGLAKSYPKRVIETPLAEDSVAGICIGAALGGMYPINTHIRADFSLLIFNQLINLAAKYKYMFGGLFSVPMMFRLIIGRSWGQGAQHSQSLQSLLGHIPGLVVLMPSTPDAVLKTFRHAINHHRGPVVILEHRLLYDIQFESDGQYALENPFSSRIVEHGNDVTIVATSVMTLEARRAASFMKASGIYPEIIDLHSISHPDHVLIFNSVKKTGRLIVLDTSWAQYGVAAEINRIINEKDPAVLKQRSISLGMNHSPCPTAKTLEDLYYPDVHDIVQAVYELLPHERTLNLPLPKKQSMTDFYKHFKGPF
jgi:pyruvate/2-oxoglutarate/acetoin dehydrogenase E1 component